MCTDSYVTSMLLWEECLYKMQSVALLNCGLPYHCLAWNCCHVWIWPQEKRELLEYQGARFAKHWIIHTICCTYVCTSHLYTSRNPLLPLLSSALCRSYFCPITGRSPCRGTLRTSWHLNRYSACTYCTFNDFCAHTDAFWHSFVIIIFTVCTVVRFIHIGSGVHLSSALCLLPVVSGFGYHDTLWPSLLSPTSQSG